jgi:hypothetical protein
MRPQPFLLLLALALMLMTSMMVAVEMIVAEMTMVDSSPRRRWPLRSPPWPSSRCAGDADIQS